MTVGSVVSASVPGVGVDQCNAKMILNAIGSEIEAAPKVEGGQLSFSTDNSANKRQGHYTSLDLKKKVWQNALAPMIWPTKFGVLYPRASGFATSADGIIDQATTSGTVAFGSFDSSFGENQTFTTGAVAGNQGGYNHARLHTMRDWNPLQKMSFKVSVSTNLRFFMGWISQTGAVGNTDDPLNALHGFGLCKITTSGNWQIAHNNNAGVTIFDDTGVAVGTGQLEFEQWADGNGNGFWWSINKSTPILVTSEIPGATSQLSFQRLLTTTAAAGIVFTVFNEFYGSDL
jgi:hypothetical protein